MNAHSPASTWPTPPAGTRAHNRPRNPARAGGRFFVAVTACLGIIAMLSVLNFVRGSPNVDVPEVWRAITAPVLVEGDPTHFLIRELRIPRVILAVICGLALGMAGVLLQDSLRNPLADPGLLGISQGASLVMVLAALYPGVLPNMARPILCLIAGALTGVAVVAFSGSIRNPVRVVLSGAVLTGFLATATTALLLLAPQERTGGLGAYFRYVTGSVSAAEWSQVRLMVPWVLVGIPAALLSGRALNLLQLGDELATGAGLNPFRARIVLTFVALVLIAPVVATIGPISFIALFAPHIARGFLATSDARQTLIISALCGGTLLLAADTVGRLLLFPAEIPAGIWTVAMVGPAAFAVIGRISRQVKAA